MEQNGIVHNKRKVLPNPTTATEIGLAMFNGSVIYGTHWRKIWFYIPYKTHSGSDIHGSILFMIDNMHYMILRIWEQDSVPWCGEIQNKRLEVLGNTFNLHPNSTFRPRSVVSQSVSKGELSSCFTRIYTPLHNNDSLKINLCMFLPFITNWLSNWAGLLGLSNWALMCGLEWDQKGPIRH